MPILAILLSIAAALCAGAWLAAVYYSIRSNRCVKNISKEMFKSAEKIKRRERYKAVLAKDTRCRELARKSGIAHWVFFGSLVVFGMVVGVIFWTEN